MTEGELFVIFVFVRFPQVDIRRASKLAQVVTASYISFLSVNIEQVKSGRSGVRFWSRQYQLCFFGYFVFYWFIFVCQCAVAAAVMLVSSSDIWSEHIIINLMLLYMIVGGVDRVQRTSPRCRRAEHLIFSARGINGRFGSVKSAYVPGALEGL